MLQRARHWKFYIQWIFIIDNLWIIWQAVLFLLSPDTIRWQKKSLPKYQQQLILWLKNKTKQTNRNLANIMILVQQMGKLNVSVIQWFVWAELSPLCLSCTFSCFRDIFPRVTRRDSMCDMAGHWLQQPLQPYGGSLESTQLIVMHSWCIPH